MSQASVLFAGENGRTGTGAAGRRLLATVVSIVLNIAAFMVLFQAYKVVRRSFIQRGEEVGYDHAHEIIRLQERLGIFFEVDLQRWVMGQEWLIKALNWYYAGFMWSLYVCCAVAIALAPERYRNVRRVFLLTFVLALPWYAIYPLAPPRFMTEYGFVDTLRIYGPNYFSNDGMVAANQFAAMPSMHIGWTTVAAMMLAVAIPYRRIGLIIGLAHLAVMTLTVMATGNHYFLDAVGGWLIVLAAVLIANRLPERFDLPWTRKRVATEPAPGYLVPARSPVTLRR